MLRADTEIQRRGNGVSYTNAIGAVSTAARLDLLEYDHDPAWEQSGRTIIDELRLRSRELPPPTACLATITSVAGFEARVEVTHLPGIADPAGATVERALPRSATRT